MATPLDAQKNERPSTYFVQDRSNEEELTRLQIQERDLTRITNRVLHEQLPLNPAALQRVLDIGCGTGGWLIETAKSYPSIPFLMGVDISDRMVRYAQTQAEKQQVSDRVVVRVMDALGKLDVPANSFDLVHQRFAQSWLRQWDWPKLLNEYWSVSKPGGVVLICEPVFPIESNSPALTSLFHLTREAFALAGHISIVLPESREAPDDLARLLKQARFEHVQTQVLLLEYRCNTVETHLFVENMKHLFRTSLPFLRKWIRLPKDYEKIYQQMLNETGQPDFAARGHILVVWGNKPSGAKHLP